jgi:hypothetical protein
MPLVRMVVRPHLTHLRSRRVACAHSGAGTWCGQQFTLTHPGASS